MGFDQYKDVLTSQDFLDSVKTTFLFAILTVPIGIVLGLGLAVLAHQQLRGIGVYRTIFSSTVASVYPLYLAKVEKKGRTQAELDSVIRWLTGFDQVELGRHLAGTVARDLSGADAEDFRGRLRWHGDEVATARRSFNRSACRIGTPLLCAGAR